MVPPKSAQKRDLQVSHCRTTCFYTMPYKHLNDHVSNMSLFQFSFFTCFQQLSGCSQAREKSICSSSYAYTERVGAWNCGIRFNFDQGIRPCWPNTNQEAKTARYIHTLQGQRLRRYGSALSRMVIQEQSATCQPSSLTSKSIIRNFKKAYKEHLDCQRNQLHPKAVTEIPSQPQGPPPLLLKFDVKLLSFLKSICRRGGVLLFIYFYVYTAGSEQQNNNSARMICLTVGFNPFTDACDLTEEWPLLLVLLYHRGYMMNVEIITFKMLMKQLRNVLYHQSLCWILTRPHHCMFQWANQKRLPMEQSRWQ